MLSELAQAQGTRGRAPAATAHPRFFCAHKHAGAAGPALPRPHAHLYGSRSFSRGKTGAASSAGCDSGMSIQPLPTLPLLAGAASADRTCRRAARCCCCKKPPLLGGLPQA